MKLRSFSKINKKTVILRILVSVYFIYLLFSRFYCLHADLPKSDMSSAYWSCNIEEKASAYNARNKILFGNWDSGGVNYQPMVYMPLSNLISLLSFALGGVSLFSLRAPYALISILAFFIFYLVLKKEFGRLFALCGTILFSSIHLITCLNRSGLAENIFILLMVTAMFFYQKFLKTKQDIYLFLFGLFSALNISVKITGINFVIITLIFVFLAAAGSKEIAFSRKKTIFAKFLFGIITGAVIYLLLLLIFYMPGGFKSIMMISSGSIRFRIYLMFLALINDLPNLFLSYAPIIAFLSLTSLFFLILSIRNRLTKLDLFNIAWLMLGILIILPFVVYYKRIIFLFPPICYLITKAFYIFWRRCKDKDEKSVTKTRFICNVIACIVFIKIAMGFLDYASIHFAGVYDNYNDNPDLAMNLVLFSMIFLIAIIPLPKLIFDKNFSGYRYAGTRLSLYVYFIVFAVMVMSSVALNEFLNFREIYFHREGLIFESYNNSRDLGELLKPAVILGPEHAFRILGFENRHKFLFRQDGSDVDGSLAKYGSDAQRQINDILVNKHIRYFCWSSTVVITKECIDGIEKIKKLYRDIKLLKTYKFGPTYIELYDKYPNGIYIK